MARLAGIGLFLWLVYTSLSFALDNAPRPDGPGSAPGTLATGWPAPSPSAPSQTPAAGPAGADPEPELGTEAAPDRLAASWSPGVYAVAGDRDLRARRSAPSGGQAPERGPSPLASSGREVSGEIAPGLYASGSETGGCSYELWRVMRDRSEQVIGEDHLDQGRLLVTINDIEPDWFTSSAGCGRWLDWAALATPLTEAGNGDYWVGDLATGLWSIPDGCRWEKVVGFRGALLHDVVDSIVGPDVVAVDGETLGVRARSCHQPAVLSIPAARAAP